MLNSMNKKGFFIVAVSSLSLLNMGYAQGATNGGVYRIVARHSGKVLEVLDGNTKNGATVQQAAWTGKDHQKWIFTDLRDGYWRGSPVHRSNAALRNNGINVEMRSYSDVDDRKWSLVNVEDGFYRLMAKGIDKCVTIDGSSMAEGANASVQTPDPSAQNQQFTFEPTGGETTTVDVDHRPESTTGGTTAMPQPDVAVARIQPAVLPPGMRPRVIATTDGEVDDRSSMIRFLLYSCDFDVAGIVQVNSKFQKNGHSDKKWIEAQLDAYEQVLPNLRKHNPDYPDAAALRSVIRVGNENIKDLWVAPPEMETKNTPGAQLIIDTLLDNDPRPIHVLSWGGANTTASALWTLKTKHPKEKFDYAGVEVIRLPQNPHLQITHSQAKRREQRAAHEAEKV